MNRPRIAHLIATNFFGGPEKQIVEHARRLRGGAVEIFLLSFLEGAENLFLARARSEGFETCALPQRPPFHPSLVGDLSSVLAEKGADVLVTHHYKATVIGRIASWRRRIPQIAVSRGWTGESAKIRLYEALDKFFLRLADRVVAVSEGQKRKVLALGVSPSKVTVIRNCIDCEAPLPAPTLSLREELGLPPGTLLVASAGRLSPEKNYGGLVRVAGKVAEKEPGAVFIVFGEGALRPELERAVTQAGLSERFLLPGFRPDVPSLLPQVDIFVLPSFTEGLPNVVLEAFAAGRPVVATAVGGTPEVVVDGEGGFLVSPEEEDAMAARILQLLADPSLRGRMGDAGRRRVREWFDPARQAEEYRRLYLEVAASLSHTIRRGKAHPWNSWKF